MSATLGTGRLMHVHGGFLYPVSMDEDAPLLLWEAGGTITSFPHFMWGASRILGSSAVDTNAVLVNSLTGLAASVTARTDGSGVVQRTRAVQPTSNQEPDIDLEAQNQRWTVLNVGPLIIPPFGFTIPGARLCLLRHYSFSYMATGQGGSLGIGKPVVLSGGGTGPNWPGTSWSPDVLWVQMPGYTAI